MDNRERLLRQFEQHLGELEDLIWFLCCAYDIRLQRGSIGTLSVGSYLVPIADYKFE